MKVRKRHLPPGWYPDTESGTRAKIESLLAGLGAPEESAYAAAGIIPHAGWDYSGRLALDTIRRMGRKPETLAVVGGHLSPGARVHAGFDEAYETPLGDIAADRELLQAVGNVIDLEEDSVPDNTVEVQLPLVKYLYPESRVVAFRAPPAQAALELGRAIHTEARGLNREVVVLGSTDLTHYGPAYGFSPKGGGEKAVEWVKEVNDRRFLKAVLSLSLNDAIDLALQEQSACSAGAAVAAAEFARQRGAVEGVLIQYTTSWDVYPASSFVGYAAIVYQIRSS